MAGIMARSLLLAAAVVLALAVGALGHVRLDSPQPRTNGDGLKTGPCGGIAPGAPTMTLTPGQTLTVRFTETICHTGSPFRIALSAGADNATCFDSHVIVDHIPHNDGCTGSFAYQYNITVPNINCQQCVLQLVQIMTDKPQTRCSGHVPDDWVTYYSCADVRINGTVSLADYVHTRQEPTGWPSPQTPYGIESATWSSTGVLQSTPAQFSYTSKATNMTCNRAPATCPKLTDGSPIAPSGQFCNDEGTYCARWTVEGTRITFEVEGATTGWMALGISPQGSMFGSDVYQMYVDEKGRVLVVDRHVTADSRSPVTDKHQDALDIEGEILQEGGEMVTKGPVTRVKFSRFLITDDDQDIAITNDAQYLIWSMREADTDISKQHNVHAASGILVNFADPSYEILPPSTPLVAAHGTLMVIAWTGFAFFGFYIARYERSKPFWYKLHVPFQSFAVLLNFVAFCIIAAHINIIGGVHFDSFHKIFGFILFFLSLGQVAIGLFMHFSKSKTPDAHDRVFPNKVHRWYGRILIALTTVNIFVGLVQANALGAIIAVFAIYFAGLVVLVGLKEMQRRGHLDWFGKAT